MHRHPSKRLGLRIKTQPPRKWAPVRTGCLVGQIAIVRVFKAACWKLIVEPWCIFPDSLSNKRHTRVRIGCIIDGFDNNAEYVRRDFSGRISRHHPDRVAADLVDCWNRAKRTKLRSIPAVAEPGWKTTPICKSHGENERISIRIGEHIARQRKREACIFKRRFIPDRTGNIRFAIGLRNVDIECARDDDARASFVAGSDLNRNEPTTCWRSADQTC